MCPQINFICAADDPRSRRILRDQNGGLARSYLTLSTLATVLQSWDDHPHHRLTTPLQRLVISAMAVFYDGRAARAAGEAPTSRPEPKDLV
jgi:hypothetical protein